MGRFSLARKVATSVVVAFLIGGLAAAATRLRPAPDPDGPDLPRAATSVGAGDWLEGVLFDGFARREASRRRVSAEIVLVSIDEVSVKRARETAGGWPWPRQYLGAIVRELRALGAKLVVVDQAFPDPSRLADDDVRFAAALDAGGGVVAGFRFGEAPEEGTLEPGRWAILQGNYATRGAALLAAGPLLVGGARPYLVPAGDRLEVWLGGHRDRGAALKEAERLRTQAGLGARDSPTLRELTAEETLDRVTVEALFAERNSVSFGGEAAHELNTFQNLQPPVVELTASGVGFGNLRLERDPDGVVRGVRHLWRHEGRYYPSLALAAAMALAGRRQVSLEDGRLHLAKLSVPVEASGVTRLRFYGRGERDGGPESPYPVIPVLSVLRSADRRAEGKSLDERLVERLKDKVAFLSFEAGACERLSSPIAPVGLHAAAWATALDNLLRSDGLMRASADQDAAIAFTMAMLGAIISALFTRGTRPLRTLAVQLAVSALACSAYLTWAWRAHRAGLWVAAAVPLLAFLAAMVLATTVNYADETHAVRSIREALGRYALPALAEQLLRRPQHLAHKGECRTLTSMVFNLRGFGAAVVAMKPTALVSLLDDLVGDVSEAVREHRGQIESVTGAHFVAYWGAPLPSPSHARDACVCALKLRDKLQGRLEAWREHHQVELDAAFGVATGEVVVGNIRGRGVFQPRYAVFGMGMASAERLCAANGPLRTQVLIGEGTLEAAGEVVDAREVDLVRLAGRVRPMRVIELCGLQGRQPDEARLFLERFDRALVAFRRGAFAPALAQFQALATERPDDGPVAVYVERCRILLAAPPGEDWDGVFESPRNPGDPEPAG